jgi:hypothetical protein
MIVEFVSGSVNNILALGGEYPAVGERSLHTLRFRVGDGSCSGPYHPRHTIRGRGDQKVHNSLLQVIWSLRLGTAPWELGYCRYTGN